MSREFTDIVAELDEGKINERATALLAEIVEQCEVTGKPGKLSITIDVKPEGSQAWVSAKIVATRPEPSTAPSLYFHKHGELHREDPRQLKLRVPQTAHVKGDD